MEKNAFFHSKYPEAMKIMKPRITASEIPAPMTSRFFATEENHWFMMTLIHKNKGYNINVDIVPCRIIVVTGTGNGD